MTNKQIPWTKFGFESILIISSILIALAVDAWWEHRKERENEQQVLASLLSEFERNKVELDRTLNTFTRSHNAVKRLLTFAGKNITDEDKVVIEQSIFELFEYWTFDPSSGALESLLSDGQLSLVQNIELRTRLAGWSGLVRDYKEEEREFDYAAYREFGPFIRKIAPLPNVEATSPGLFESQWQGAFDDVQFLNLVGLLSILIDSIIIEASMIGNEADRIITLIEAELE